MATITANFTAAEDVTASLYIRHGDKFSYDVSGTFVGTVALERSQSGGQNWEHVLFLSGSASAQVLVSTKDQQPANYRFRCSAYTSGTIDVQLADVAVILQSFKDKEGSSIFEVREDGINVNGLLYLNNGDTVVGGTTPETLENKTLTTPLINGGTIDSATIDDSTINDPTIDGGTIAGMTIGTSTLNGPVLSDPTGNVMYDPGSYPQNILSLANDVVEGDTLTIGADVWEVEVVNTDSTDNTQGGDFNNLTDPLTVVDAVTNYANVVFGVKKLIRIENEILYVQAVAGNDVTFKRGVHGTTTATHADALDIFQGDGIAGGSTEPLGLVADLSPAAFFAALEAAIDYFSSEPTPSDTISANEMLFVYQANLASTLAVAETFTNANNEWASPTFYGGRAAQVRKMSVVHRVPTAVEVALGNLHFLFPYSVSSVQVFIAPTATPGLYKLYDGAVTVNTGSGVPSSSGSLVTLDNSGLVDFAETDTVTVIAYA